MINRNHRYGDKKNTSTHTPEPDWMERLLSVQFYQPAFRESFLRCFQTTVLCLHHQKLFHPQPKLWEMKQIESVIKIIPPADGGAVERWAPQARKVDNGFPKCY